MPTITTYFVQSTHMTSLGKLLPTSAHSPLEFPRQQFVDFLGLQQQTEESLDLVVSQPMLTGICSRCGAEIERDESGVVHWDCPCG